MAGFFHVLIWSGLAMIGLNLLSVYGKKGNCGKQYVVLKSLSIYLSLSEGAGVSFDESLDQLEAETTGQCPQGGVSTCDYTECGDCPSGQICCPKSCGGTSCQHPV